MTLLSALGLEVVLCFADSVACLFALLYHVVRVAIILRNLSSYNLTCFVQAGDTPACYKQKRKSILTAVKKKTLNT